MSVCLRGLLRAAGALFVAALIVFGAGLVNQAEAQKRRGRSDRYDDRFDRYGRHDRGRHLGWERGRRVGQYRRGRDGDWDDRDPRRRELRRSRRELRRERREDRRDARRYYRRDRRAAYYGSPLGYYRR